jgi:hypothetical protein
LQSEENDTVDLKASMTQNKNQVRNAVSFNFSFKFNFFYVVCLFLLGFLFAFFMYSHLNFSQIISFAIKKETLSLDFDKISIGTDVFIMYIKNIES